MSGGISVHAVDVAEGRPAVGLRVTIVALEAAGPRPVAEGTIGPGGSFDHPVVRGVGVAAGTYEAVFHLGAYFTGQGRPGPHFLDAVPFRFTVTDAAEHYHLPLKFTRFGYAVFRGV
ncbi:hydroxyisourate hydrolase [Methylobacterium platani]|uniref:5-hydroxyisourate hydrolase n=2 Tax=Methylobacterium platani TaxID=427683 RepID=A0A179S5F9_9HYPH|nr:hydroxyisourate hydrolase [Methylobacterium platani]KMO17889.1 transthyretin [Methylobacterium platani JCM 14648]OAS22424.1 5-hydroxyisourate hydrolase [Methylobacterium platani]